MKHMILPLLILGLFFIAVTTETNLIIEKDVPPSRARQVADLVIEPDKSKDSFREVKKSWNALLNKTQDLIMQDIKAIDDALMQSLELKKKDE